MNPLWRRRLWLWGPPVLYMAAIFVLSSFRVIRAPLLRRVAHGDKVVHALEYALLCVLLFRALRMTHRPWLCRLAAPAAFVVSILYGAFDEVHQHFVGRNMDFFDWLADAGGAGVVALILALYVKFRADPQRGYPRD